MKNVINKFEINGINYETDISSTQTATLITSTPSIESYPILDKKNATLNFGDDSIVIYNNTYYIIPPNTTIKFVVENSSALILLFNSNTKTFYQKTYNDKILNNEYILGTVRINYSYQYIQSVNFNFEYVENNISDLNEDSFIKTHNGNPSELRYIQMLYPNRYL